MLLSSIFLAVSTCWYLPDRWLYTRKGCQRDLALALIFYGTGAPPWLLSFCTVLCQRDVDGLLWSTVAAIVTAAPPPPDCWDTITRKRNAIILLFVLLLLLFCFFNGGRFLGVWAAILARELECTSS